ncbi:MAG: hypothetical protein CFE44_00860 [Burkholderiales bacterium PBB4]|nr:MAG: hypothetical protein CFE44_00860 [Burkholderiales bacterium PBB4]
MKPPVLPRPARWMWIACGALAAPALAVTMAEPADAGNGSFSLAQATPGRPTVVEREIRLVTPGGDEHANARVVKGAPYCADALHETTQWLFDPSSQTPNKIARKSSSRLCRDSEGRTRLEQDSGGRKLVFLKDPVANENWMLDPERKTAVRLGQRALTLPSGLTPTPDTPPLPVTVTRNETVSPDGKRRTMEVQVIRRAGAEGATPLPPEVPHPGEMLIQTERMAGRGQGVVVALPAKDMEGVQVHGERTTWTTEPGKVGNEKAIVQTREVWTSPELMLKVYSRSVDPRSGETLYKLSNLKRGEPDAALFKVPAGYETLATPAMMRMPNTPKPGAAASAKG